MWIVFGNRTRARPAPGGREIERHCPECNQTRKFVECDVADKVSLFFVRVLEMKNRRMVCPECGEDFEVPQSQHAPAAATPRAPAKSELKARPSEGDLDRMLADLKKKMNK